MRMFTQGLKIGLLLSLFATFLSAPSLARAEYFFNPHFILTNEEMSNQYALSLAQIQQFLEDRNSYLAVSSYEDYLGVTRSAAEIIWNSAQENKINPQVILTTLQKEQSLIGDPAPTQRQLDRAMGYRCPDSGSCNPSTLAFGKQVEGATWQFRQYLDNPQNWNFQVGGNYIVDDVLVSPTTDATAGLYNYTPHIHGNERFWRLWIEYWGRQYPDGSLLKAAGQAGVWYVQYGSRRPIMSYSVLLSRFDPRRIITVALSDLEKYEIGPPISFPNFSLLQGPDGKVYLVVDDTIRHIETEEVFRSIGFNWDEIEVVDQSTLDQYQYGEPITLATTYPTGALLQNKATGGVYYVKDGLKHPIVSKEIMKTRFGKKVLTQVSPEQLDQFPDAEPILFADGELIKSSTGSEVYVVTNGLRRWIPTEAVFEKFGYKWDTIITTTEAAVLLHPLGETLE